MRLETKYFIIFSTLFIFMGIVAIFVILLYDRSYINSVDSETYTITKSDLNNRLIFTNQNLTSIDIPSNIKNWKGNVSIQHFYKDVLVELTVPGPSQIFITELEQGSTPYTGIPIDGRVWFQENTSQIVLRLKVLSLDIAFVNEKVFITGQVVHLDGL